jgi:uncharacterized membrane protein YagU involved in acid resistance
MVHYSFGAVMGALYGGLAEAVPRAGTLGGAAFGTAVWIGADELAIPMLGLSHRRTEYPLETHVQALAAHLVFGIATDLIRRAARAVLVNGKECSRHAR